MHKSYVNPAHPSKLDVCRGQTPTEEMASSTYHTIKPHLQSYLLKNVAISLCCSFKFYSFRELALENFQNNEPCYI